MLAVNSKKRDRHTAIPTEQKKNKHMETEKTVSFIVPGYVITCCVYVESIDTPKPPKGRKEFKAPKEKTRETGRAELAESLPAPQALPSGEQPRKRPMTLAEFKARGKQILEEEFPHLFGPAPQVLPPKQKRVTSRPAHTSPKPAKRPGSGQGGKQAKKGGKR